jgi:hypothetical protein
MSKKIVWGIVGIIVLVGVFFGGVSYGKGQAASKVATTGAAAYAGARTRGAGGFGGATIGQILSENAQSITIALPSGGSEIVLLDNTTPITKQASGTMSDLAVGTTVSVIGTANADGSVTAQSIQIRPAMAAKPTQ